MLITFSGVDGSGKTTQIEWLARELTGRGHRVQTVWFRPGYSNELDTLRRWARRIVPRALPTREQAEARERAFSRPGVRRTWFAMAWTDVLVQWGLKLRVLGRGGRVVLCDRYLDDAVIDLRLRFPELRAATSALAGLVGRLLPEPDAAFLLSIPHSEMVRRLADKREPFPDPPELRRERFEAYAELGATGRLDVIDAADTAENVHRAIVSRLGERAS